MGRGAVVSIVAVTASIVAHGCSSGVFQCQVDADCAGAGGMCEAIGYCSFPDSACASGQKYGEHSGSLSNECVVDGGTETSPGSGGTSGPAGTTSPSGTTAASDDTTASTIAVSASSGTGATTGEATGSTGGDAGSTGDTGGTGLCVGMALGEETFEAIPMAGAGWEPYAGGSAVASVQDEVLHVGVDMPDPSSPESYWGMHTEGAIPESGSVGFEVVSAAPSDVPVEVYLWLGDGASIYYFVVTEGELRSSAIESGIITASETAPYDPDAHRWLRLTFDAPSELIDFETSVDGEDWILFDSVGATALDFGIAWSELGAGAWQGPLVDQSVAAFDNAFFCGPP